MRAFHLLVGLVSLLGLVSGEPDELSACTQPVGTQFGLCHRMLALDHCFNLIKGLAGNVRSIHQKQGAICYFYPQQGCSTGWRSLEINTSKGDFVQDIAENVGRQIVSVHCFRALQAVGEREDSVSPATIQARSEAVNDTPLPTKVNNILSLPGQSDLIICKGGSSETPCEALNATEICAPLGSVAHNVRIIYQAAGTVCKFYDRDCSNRHAILTLNSLSGSTHRRLDAAIGDRLGVVVCRPTWRPDEAHARSQPRALRAAAAAAVVKSSVASTTSPPSPTSSSTSDQWEGRDDQPLYICRLTNLEGRCTYYSEPGCQNNPFGDQSMEPILSFKVRWGWRCVFYHEPNCAGQTPPNYEEAHGGDRTVWDVPYAVGSMNCMRNPVRESAVPQTPLKMVGREETA